LSCASDEILNGKTLDRNSNYFARYCFEHGIELCVLYHIPPISPPPRLVLTRRIYRKRVEVIADDQDEIIEASRRMVQKYDFVVTSGGIGPTHDGKRLSAERMGILIVK
jgi:molybdopterin-biosynthesis enzyme MoeA-like protein